MAMGTYEVGMRVAVRLFEAPRAKSVEVEERDSLGPPARAIGPTFLENLPVSVSDPNPNLTPRQHHLYQVNFEKDRFANIYQDFISCCAC